MTDGYFENAEHDGYIPFLALGLRLIEKNPLLYRLLTSAPSPHALLHRTGVANESQRTR
jgi:hypothetical protein